MTCQAVPAHLVHGEPASGEDEGVSGRDGTGVPVIQYNTISAGTTTIVFSIGMHCIISICFPQYLICNEFCDNLVIAPPLVT